ncbi:MAG: hypothetical protein K9G39_06415 [Chlorobium sp.]|uniref:surface-adhesin E family protein n=1 Tax=Chlorobium sp. TaxID=1095 RepID=UPI0025B9FA6F|nr:surface-adhesin E family protein [Chlorobium sp.]MCF8383216.1 hypothetical protein [Chlorobium sp.]
MKRIKALLIAEALVLLALPAQAAKWVYVNKASDGSTAYVDTETIDLLSTGNIKYWYRFDYDTPKDTGTEQIQTVICLKELDPSAREEKTLYVSCYSGPSMTGRVVATGDPQCGIDPLIPGTLADAVSNFVCKRAGIKLGALKQKKKPGIK